MQLYLPLAKGQLLQDGPKSTGFHPTAAYDVPLTSKMNSTSFVLFNTYNFENYTHFISPFISIHIPNIKSYLMIHDHFVRKDLQSVGSQIQRM